MCRNITLKEGYLYMFSENGVGRLWKRRFFRL